MKNLQKMLDRYKKAQMKIDILNQETSDILATSGFGQAPPVFHRKVDQMLAIKIHKQAPLWEDLRRRIIPNSPYKTFWQEIPWTIGTLPPDYFPVERAYKKYSTQQTRQNRSNSRVQPRKNPSRQQVNRHNLTHWMRRKR